MKLSAKPYDDFQTRTVAVCRPGMEGKIAKGWTHQWPSSRMANESAAPHRTDGRGLPLMFRELVLGADGDGKIDVHLRGIGVVVDAVPGKDGVRRDAKDQVL